LRHAWSPSDFEDPNNTTPVVYGIPDETEEVAMSDLTTMALEKSKLRAARLRDEIEAIMQGDQAVIKRALELAEIKSYVQEASLDIVRAVGSLGPRQPLPDDLLDAAKTLLTFLAMQR